MTFLQQTKHSGFGDRFLANDLPVVQHIDLNHRPPPPDRTFLHQSRFAWGYYSRDSNTSKVSLAVFCHEKSEVRKRPFSLSRC